jgi:hypothetical protein
MRSQGPLPGGIFGGAFIQPPRCKGLGNHPQGLFVLFAVHFSIGLHVRDDFIPHRFPDRLPCPGICRTQICRCAYRNGCRRGGCGIASPCGQMNRLGCCPAQIRARQLQQQIRLRLGQLTQLPGCLGPVAARQCQRPFGHAFGESLRHDVLIVARKDYKILKACGQLNFGGLQTAVLLRSAAHVRTVHCAAVLAKPPFSAPQNPIVHTP